MESKMNLVFERLSQEDLFNEKKSENEKIFLNWADPFRPDNIMPLQVKNACADAILDGNSHYTLPLGRDDLRIEIAQKLKKFNKIEVNHNTELIVTPGSDTGLFFSMMPFITPGNNDEILVPAPSYISNFSNCELLGAKCITIPLDENKNYELDIQEFEKKLSNKTKLIVLTNPNNPTGKSYTKKELENLSDFVIKNNLVVIVDQAFEDTVFDEYRMETLANYPNMFNRTVTVFSVSKGMGLCGFRVGYIVACEKFMRAYQQACVNVMGATNTIAQIGALEAFRKNSFVEEYRKEFQNRTEKAYEIITSIEYVKCQKPQAGFYLWVNVSQLGTGNEVADYLNKEADIIVNSGEKFGINGKNYIRIIVAAYKDREKLYTALYKVKYALERLGDSKNK